MAKIENPTAFAALVNKADELQRKLSKLTGNTSDDYAEACRKADLLIEKQATPSQGGFLVPEGNPNDGKFRMIPDQTLRSTQQATAVLEFKQKQLERVIRVAEGKLKAETDPARKVELSNKLAQTKETLSEIVQEKVSARTLSMNEISELNQKLRREMNAAKAAGDVQRQAEIRARQIELARERSNRAGIRTRV
jgi:hypothetical protein